MKTVVLFGRRNTGLLALSVLVAKGYVVKVVSDDENILWLAKELNCEVVNIDAMGNFDIVLSVHWDKIIPTEYFQNKPACNIHPLLFKYKGKNPVQKYIENKDTLASVESHYMENIVDEGEVIHQEFFYTPECKSYADFYNIALPFYFKSLSTTLDKITR